MILAVPFLISTRDGKCSQKRISGITGFLFLENKYKANAALRNRKPQELRVETPRMLPLKGLVGQTHDLQSAWWHCDGKPWGTEVIVVNRDLKFITTICLWLCRILRVYPVFSFIVIELFFTNSLSSSMVVICLGWNICFSYLIFQD